MITRVLPKGNRAFSRVGLGDVYIFARLDGRIADCTYDVFEFTSSFTSSEDDSLYNLLSGIERGELWDIVEDGETYTPEKIKDMIGD